MPDDLLITMKHENTRIALNTPEFPAVLQRAGAAACFAADEFFSARISNWETRRAYARAVRWFFKWCDGEQLELAQITPGIAGRFIRSLKVSDATKNQTLAAMRHFFDILVERHAVVLNPFHSVRGIKYKVIDGKTPEITIARLAPSSPPSTSASDRTPGPRHSRNHDHHRMPGRGPLPLADRRPAASRGRAHVSVPGEEWKRAGDPRAPRPGPVDRRVPKGRRDRRRSPRLPALASSADTLGALTTRRLRTSGVRPCSRRGWPPLGSPPT